MAKFFYEVRKDSKTGRLLTMFLKACNDAERAAERYAKKVGAMAYYDNAGFFVGGVEYVTFENPDRVNKNVWRLAFKTDTGELWWEPNVTVKYGCVKERSGLKPSDTANRIYDKQPCGWDDVRQIYSLSEWLHFLEFNSTGNKEDDTKFVVKLLGNKKFLKYIEILPSVAVPKGRKRSKDGGKAVYAERERLRLPTVRVEDFYQIMNADISVGDEGETEEKKTKKREMCTPVFFMFRDMWYLSMDYPSANDDAKKILPAYFTLTQREMLKEMEDTNG